MHRYKSLNLRDSKSYIIKVIFYFLASIWSKAGAWVQLFERWFIVSARLPSNCTLFLLFQVELVIHLQILFSEVDLLNLHFVIKTLTAWRFLFYFYSIFFFFWSWLSFALVRSDRFADLWLQHRIIISGSKMDGSKKSSELQSTVGIPVTNKRS